MKRLNNTFSFAEDVRLFAQILLMIAALPFLLRFLSLPRLMSLFSPTRKRIPKDLERSKETTVTLLDYLLTRTFALHRRNFCLKRSLILYHFLSRWGMDVQLCLGVKPSGKSPPAGKPGAIEGHAWLLWDGSPYLEKNIELTMRYRTTFRYPEKIKHSA